MAPAWPICLPSGAVNPAMYATTGLVMRSAAHAAASCSALPPISPIMTTAFVSASCSEFLQGLQQRGADDGVAADAQAGGEADVAQLAHQLVGQCAGLGDQSDGATAHDAIGDDTEVDAMLVLLRRQG